MNELSFRLLKVNLTNGESSTEIISSTTLRKFLGGASLAAHVLYPYLKSSLDPLSPDSPLLFMTGPLTGTTGPAVGRFVICAKSPATHLWGESNIGGSFGPELRKAGYDGLLLAGACTSPKYLWIKDDAVELRPASHLWGKTDTYETQASIREEIGCKKARICCIGVAGERLIPFASILCDHGRVAGRTGMGAVMGSKRLKAVAVEGNQEINIIHPDKFNKLRREINIALKDDNLSRAFRDYGTASGVDYMDYLGEMPKLGFTRGSLDGVSEVSGMTMAETILRGKSTCHGCVIACGRVVELGEGKKIKGPEYETIVGFGPNLGIIDLRFISRMGDLCDRLGMDTISMSNIISLAFLLYNEGIITSEEIGGFDLAWGNKEAIKELIMLTSQRKGFGEILARGAKVLAEQYGIPGLAAQVKGLEAPYHDPRGGSGSALVYATSPRGACHMQGDYFWVDTMARADEDLGIKAYKRHEGAVKSENVARHQDWSGVFNALVQCMHANVPVSAMVDLVNWATGFEYTLDDLIRIGERSWNLRRVINHNLGLTKDDDTLPETLRRPFPDGGSADYVVPFREMMDAYYEARNWDNDTGRPMPDKLRELGLEEYIDELWM